MKAICILILLGLFCLQGKAQTKNTYAMPSSNDTSYIRILDGIILRNNQLIEHVGAVRFIRQKETIAAYGFDTTKTTKPLMILQTTDRLSIEEKIDSTLYSNQTFINKYQFPLDIHLPVSINRKLLLNDQKKNILMTLDYQKIKSIRYSKNEISSTLTPFGVIEVLM